MARRKLLAVPEDQLMLCTSTHGPPSNSLQLTEASAPADSISSSLLQQSSSAHPLASQAGSCSNQATNASSHQSAEQRSPSLTSVASESPPNQAAQATNSSLLVAAPPNSVCVPPAVLHAPRAIPAAASGARSGSAPPHVFQLGPIFQPMLAAMQTNPFFPAKAPTEAPHQALHPAQASLGPVTPALAANEPLQHMLHAAQAIGYCQGLKTWAAQTDKLQKLSFHSCGVMPSSSADQAVQPPGPSQPQQAQPDNESHHTHRQVVVASDAQTAPQPQADAGAAVAQPCPGLRNPEEAFSQALLAQKHLGVGELEPYRETGSLESQTLGRSLSGNKRAHEASDAHMHTSSSKKQRLVEVAQQCDASSSGHNDSKGIMFRCNIADILDALCGPFSQMSSSARAGSTSVRAGPSRASPTMPSASAAGANRLPAMSAASTLRSASTSASASLPHQSQDMAGRLALLPQLATAQSVVGAVAAAQGTDWALAAHAAALRSSWQNFLPHVGPQPSIANQLQGLLSQGDQAGVPSHPMLTSFPQDMNQLMVEQRTESMPSWVADQRPAAPPLALGSSGGQRQGQEDVPPNKRPRQGADSQVATAAAAPSLHPLSSRQLPQLTSIQLLKHRARQHMANADAAPLGSSLPSSFHIPSAASTAQLASSQHASAVSQSGLFNRASSAEAHGHARAIGSAWPNSDTVFTSAQTMLPRQRSALAQLSALSIGASAQIDLTDSPTAMDASSTIPNASGGSGSGM